MQIKRLSIDNHLCLVDFHINFQTISGGSSTILIGENGTGKSTMIDTVLEILMSFDSPARADAIEYNYELEYEYAQKEISLQKQERKYIIKIDNEILEGGFDYIRYRLKHISIFPQRIITFYSGLNNKIAKRIEFDNRTYKSRCKRTLEKYLQILHSDTENFMPYFPKRKYNYCNESLVPIYLCSILGGQNSYEKHYLQNECHFRHVENIDMIIDLDKVEALFGNRASEKTGPRNLYLISDFIDHRFTDILRDGFSYCDGRRGFFEIVGLKSLNVDSISILEFFEKLQTLFDAEYEVTVAYGNVPVSSSAMSEGQRQLIKVLGMLGICKSEDCLVLMDEPDAHMNPKWKYEIKAIMDHSLQKAINTQALIATHDPLVINGVSKEFIRIFAHTTPSENEGYFQTKVIVPTEDTEGLGIDGLLQSEYYGLHSVLDTETRRHMELKQDLLIKKYQNTLSQEESEKLSYLTEKLDNLTFTRNIPTDSYYDEYVAAMHKIYRDQTDKRVRLTAEDIAERNAKAEEILRGLLGL